MAEMSDGLNENRLIFCHERKPKSGISGAHSESEFQIKTEKLTSALSKVTHQRHLKTETNLTSLLEPNELVGKGTPKWNHCREYKPPFFTPSNTLQCFLSFISNSVDINKIQ